MAKVGSEFELMNFVLKFQIKKLDPASRRVTTLAGTGKAGFKDGAALAAQVRKILVSFSYFIILHSADISLVSSFDFALRQKVKLFANIVYLSLST